LAVVNPKDLKLNPDMWYEIDEFTEISERANPQARPEFPLLSTLL
jgi:hypothetical protein